MYFLKLLLSAVLLVVVVQARTENSEEPDCGDKSDCEYLETHKICALDKEKICFTRFDNECYMAYTACKKQREFQIFADAYCDLEGFMCTNDYEKFVDDWLDHENMDETIYGIYVQNKTENAAT